ncbi:MAG: PAS domain S-box protein [bacterium]
MTKTGKSDILQRDILIVDDNPVNLKTLTSMLTGRGYQVRTAISGELALKTVQKSIPDLIILDIRMPGMNGYQVCQYLKLDAQYCHIPVIFISALTESQDKIHAFEAGGVDYITKPFETEEVLARVETHLRLSALQRELEIQNEHLLEEINERILAQNALRRSYDKLEERVVDRTRELAKANADLNQKIKQHKQAEEELLLNKSRFETLYKLSQMANEPEQVIKDFALEESVRMTGSQIGYLFFLNEDETVLTIHAWSKEAWEQCHVPEKQVVYKVEEAGLWGEAVRQRKPVITNDYEAPSSLKKGYPEGHTPIKRHMNIPLIDNGKIVLVAGVANKKEEYNDTDVQQLTLIMDGMWRIIQKKKIEKALKESEVHFRSTFEQAAVGIAHVSPEGRFLKLNQRFCDLVGYTQEEMLAFTFQDITHPDDLFIDLENMNQVLEGKIKTYSMEKRYLRKDGSVVWVNLTVSLVREASGEPKYFIGIVQDISQRRETEKELAVEKERLAVTLRSKDRLADTLRSIGDAVVTMDMDGRIVLFNAVAEGLTGWSRQEAEGKFFADVFHLIHEDTKEPCQNPLEIAMETGTTVDLVRGTVLMAKDGRGKLIAGNIVPMRDAQGNPTGLIMVCRDITEKQKVEEELQKASKLESIGLLAGGIAHDFNNILTIIIGNIDLAKMFISSEHAIYRPLVEAKQASMRAKSLTHQLLTFAKGGAPIKQIVSIAELLKDWTAFALKGSRIGYTFAIQEDLWPVKVDERQISQVINNLIINADQAMPEGGMLAVQAKNRDIAEESIVHALRLPKGKYVEISIQDQGYGIPKENLNKIFDPYFTTRKTGSGLGLTVSYSIIKSHEGYLTAESEIGVGTTFYIYLPAFPQEITAVKKAPAEKEEILKEPLAGRGRILVMDDEDMMRNMLYQTLTFLGYDAALAKDGTEAIDLYRKAQESDRPFDAVIMDLIIPGGMGGEETMKEIIKIDSNAKVIVSSGYSSDPIMANYREYGFKECLVKPYDPHILSQRLDRVIKGNR